jgi:solute carrier family 35 (UDP-galactose transporter), member B1
MNRPLSGHEQQPNRIHISYHRHVRVTSHSFIYPLRFFHPCLFFNHFASHRRHHTFTDMARRKQLNPMQRIPSGEIMQTPPDVPEIRSKSLNGHIITPASNKSNRHTPADATVAPRAGVVQFMVCVLGIYASLYDPPHHLFGELRLMSHSLTWAYLQERITTTPYTSIPDSIFPKHDQEYFRFPIFLNTVQSLFAFLSGSIYLYSTQGSLSVFPSKAILGPLLLVSLTSVLASPFGYASLSHVDYLTFVLAKSCKLLPVMALHITLFRKRYPLSKYLIVLAVTSGVAIFTVYHPPKSGSKAKGTGKSSMYGLALLGVNLLFDGLTNTVQDHIFRSPSRYGKIRGPQMMVAQNILATLLMAAYLILMPLIPVSLLPAVAQDSTHELSSALAFLHRHPSVLYDVLGFAACGAFGQIFIYLTLERFSSLLLVMVTVTRKMMTMLLSVIIFGKTLTGGQWMGVGLVFAGVVAEGGISHVEKGEKAKPKRQ